MFANFKAKQKKLEALRAEKATKVEKLFKAYVEAVDTAADSLLKKSKKQIPCTIMMDVATVRATFKKIGQASEYTGSRVKVTVTKVNEILRKVDVTEV